MTSGYGAQISWDAPASSGDGDILGYIVETYIPGNAQSLVLEATTNATTRTAAVGWCRDDRIARVRALNRCGYGAAAEFSAWNIPQPSPTAYILTGSGSANIPCWANTVTAYCVGTGGGWVDGGAAGGLAWKSWTYAARTQDWSGAQVAYSVTSSGTSVTFESVTISAEAAIGLDTGGWSHLTADGGARGNPGGTDNASFSSAGIPYSGTFAYGGSIGWGDDGPGGTTIRPALVSPCKRMPARDRNNLLARVALAGGKVTEDCATAAAFGSGGVRIPYAAYGASNQYFSPGYGGGGFDSTVPGGPGCVVLYFAH